MGLIGGSWVACDIASVHILCMKTTSRIKELFVLLCRKKPKPDLLKEKVEIYFHFIDQKYLKYITVNNKFI